ncbi:hypothetical protein B0H63DRAFT_518904 [Podospora didyma]|uniref:Uncharacterized protein n=1 Tax=Podospora didyma TaxID=330526 RepID=A0AAE0NXQ8_9PEZI|nr:hypothetical protein B0H63DRAFT_518904 [Podospora didyma]
MSAAAQILTGTLVSSPPAIQVKAPGAGKIVAEWGYVFIRIAWVASGLALAAAVLWTLIIRRDHRARAGAGRSRMSGFATRRGGDGPRGFVLRRGGRSYNGLSDEQEEVAGLRQSRARSRDPSPVGHLEREPSPYEPKRHLNV